MKMWHYSDLIILYNNKYMFRADSVKMDNQQWTMIFFCTWSSILTISRLTIQEEYSIVFTRNRSLDTLVIKTRLII
ncbi:hypothetical protein HanXRQr2_Chr10g0460721 [Helianthus annuus]|uniref:Uncharacterized protein n=1 Tax=Helianthus annuus TaxID=4232 RepID=A0A9K3I1D5_HELAN|nr:hypothetical protein HanXRQr2_Chr10g0460721 [Helianthus annuus]KAJ0885400.1 hypothetical protein HanPSC8_Chr10g0444811 [Helianthus annuus]